MTASFGSLARMQFGSVLFRGITMRKIAREAVRLALVGAIVASVWFFIQESESFRRTEVDRAQSDVRAVAASDDPAYRILFNAQNAENETRTEAWRIFHKSENMEELNRRLDLLNLPQAVNTDLRDAKARCFPDFIPYPSNPRKTESALPKGFIPIYCTKFQLPAGLTPLDNGNHLEFPGSMRWPEPRATRLKVVTHSLPPALFMGLIVGFPAGLGVWLFYRLVRFAIQG